MIDPRTPTIEATGIRASFGSGRRRVRALDGLDLVAPAGAVTAVLGPNGAGRADQLADHVVILDHGRAIADGTPAELKRRAGRDMVEVRVRDRADLSAAAAILAPLGTEATRLDEPDRRVAVPVEDGTARLADAVAALATAGIALDDVGVRRPTLDEVFLALTGRRATDDDAITDDSGAPHDRQPVAA